MPAAVFVISASEGQTCFSQVLDFMQTVAFPVDRIRVRLLKADLFARNKFRSVRTWRRVRPRKVAELAAEIAEYIAAGYGTSATIMVEGGGDQPALD